MGVPVEEGKTKLYPSRPARAEADWLDWVMLAVLAILAGLIRYYPEIKAGSFPIGYDTFNAYVPDILKFDGNFYRWLFSSDLLYIILWPIHHFFQVDINLLVKIAGAALYGLLTGSFYLFCRKFLNWKILPSLLAGAFLMIQLAALRISWDLFRNMLALIFLLGGLYFLHTNHKIKNLIFLGFCSVLIVLANPLVAGLWFVLIFIWLIDKLVKKDFHGFFLTLLGILPAIVLFGLSLISNQTNNFGGRVFYEAESDRILTYFTAYTNRISYSELTNKITTLFWLLFKFVWPLVLYGFWLMRKNLLLTTLTIWLLLGSFSSLIFGGYGLFVWDRWMIMLVFPFTIYFVWGGWNLGQSISDLKFFKKKWLKPVLIILGIIFWALYFSCLAWHNYPFLTTPAKKAKMPFANKLTDQYFPVSMLNNSVGLENLPDVLKCLEYLNQKAPDQSVIAVDNRYRGVVISNVDFSRGYVYSFPWASKINQDALTRLRGQNIGPVYTIWSAKSQITGFRRVFISGNLAVWRDQKSYRLYRENIED